MKRNTTILLALLVILTAVAAEDAGAGWLNKKTTTDYEAKLHRFDRTPTLGYTSGTLNLSPGGQWEMDGTVLSFTEDCRIWSDDSTTAELQDGAKVILMGQNCGGSYLAWQVFVQKPDHSYYGAEEKNPSIVWSESDPTLGEGKPGEY